MKYIIYVKIQEETKHYSSGQQVTEEIAPLLQKEGMEGEGSMGPVTHPECWLRQTTEQSTSSASLPPVSIAQCASDTNVVLLLGHLGRNAHADLVEPLVTAAVTLDPVHLQATAQQPHF